MTTITTERIPEPAALVDFTWSPIGSAFTFSINGNSYPPVGDRFAAYYTPVNQLITFTAAVESTVPIIEYRWDLGDGTIKSGSVIGHTYNVPNPSLTVKLEVKDSLSRSSYVAKVLLLQVMYATVTTGNLRVAP
jgi:hypothetical protein